MLKTFISQLNQKAMIVANQQFVLPAKDASVSKVIPLKITEPTVGISILIPVFNYSVFNLVNTLQNYLFDERVDVEIICCDDGSSKFLEENKAIASFANCVYYKSKKNKGRAQTINFMAQKASKDYLLILDCDVLPKNVSFFQRYFNAVQEGNDDVIFGGWEYMPTITNAQNLRWLFGIYREAASLEQRLKNPYGTTFTSNILIKKELFNNIRFESSLTQYGYEDFLFIKTLEKRNIKINHISNEIYHLNEDYSKDYIEKTKKALDNLVYLHNTDFLELNDSKIGKLYSGLRTFRMNFLIDIFFRLFKNRMERKLKSLEPSLFVFDIYKMGYFCHKMNKTFKK